MVLEHTADGRPRREAFAARLRCPRRLAGARDEPVAHRCRCRWRREGPSMSAPDPSRTPGLGFRLDPADELPHTPDASPSWNESVYGNAFDPVHQVGAGSASATASTRRPPRSPSASTSPAAGSAAGSPTRPSPPTKSSAPAASPTGSTRRCGRSLSTTTARSTSSMTRPSSAAPKTPSSRPTSCPAPCTGSRPRSSRFTGANRSPRRSPPPTGATSRSAILTCIRRSRGTSGSAPSTSSSTGRGGATIPGVRATGRTSSPIGSSPPTSATTSASRSTRSKPGRHRSPPRDALFGRGRTLRGRPRPRRDGGLEGRSAQRCVGSLPDGDAAVGAVGARRDDGAAAESTRVRRCDHRIADSRGDCGVHDGWARWVRDVRARGPCSRWAHGGVSVAVRWGDERTAGGDLGRCLLDDGRSGEGGLRAF